MNVGGDCIVFNGARVGGCMIGVGNAHILKMMMSQE